MTNPEGLLFGDAGHLPDARALEGLDFRRNTLEGTLSVASLPEYPDSVVRIEPLVVMDNAGYYDVARQGILHFNQLSRCGVNVPPQRLVVAPSVFGDEQPLLYSFTDYIEGRNLTYDPQDAHLSEPVIESVADYFHWVHRQPTDDPFLWDIIHSWQYTVTDTPDNTVLLHDVGLRFSDVEDNRRQKDELAYWSAYLEEWANEADIKHPKSLKLLMRDVEPLPRRLVRRLMWKLSSLADKSEAGSGA